MFGIIAASLAVWALVTALDPKGWRQWWMAMLGLTDMNTTREQRRRQEFYLSLGGYIAFSLFLGLTVIIGYLVFARVQNQRRALTDYERAKDIMTKDFKKMQKTGKQPQKP